MIEFQLIKYGISCSDDSKSNKELSKDGKPTDQQKDTETLNATSFDKNEAAKHTGGGGGSGNSGGGDSPNLCPQCGVPLKIVSKGRRQIAACPSCHFFFLQNTTREEQSSGKSTSSELLPRVWYTFFENTIILCNVRLFDHVNMILPDNEIDKQPQPHIWSTSTPKPKQVKIVVTL